jgi:hypothetical protein
MNAMSSWKNKKESINSTPFQNNFGYSLLHHKYSPKPPLMVKKKFDTVDFDDFVSLFMKSKENGFEHNRSFIQIYPLSIAFKYIKTPIPLFRAKYNFILFFKSGGGSQRIDNELYDLKENDILFIREGHLNAIKHIVPSTDGYFLYLDSRLLSQIFGSRVLLNRLTFNPKHTVTADVMAWLLNCCELLLQSQQDKEQNFSEIGVSLSKALVQKLTQNWPESYFKTKRQSEITMRFKELLYDNFLTKQEVGFYANELAVSENYLTR